MNIVWQMDADARGRIFSLILVRMADETVCLLVAPKLAAWSSTSPSWGGIVDDLGLNGLSIKSAKVQCPMECREIVGVAALICHLTRCLRQLNEIFDAKGCRPWVDCSDKVNEVHKQLDADEFHILAARVEAAVDHRQEYR